MAGMAEKEISQIAYVSTRALPRSLAVTAKASVKASTAAP